MWYRKWSDGWIEQGNTAAATTATLTTITLLKSFSNTRYSIRMTDYGTSIYSVSFGYWNKQKATFQVVTGDGNKTSIGAKRGFTWEAVGY